MLDTLSLTGEVGWARLSPSSRDATQLVGATPVALFLREHAERWAMLSIEAETVPPALRDERPQGAACLVADALRTRGASFIGDLTSACGLDEAAVRGALGDLVAAGLVASDGFGGLRTIVRASGGRPTQTTRRSVTGRWSLFNAPASPAEAPAKYCK